MAKAGVNTSRWPYVLFRNWLVPLYYSVTNNQSEIRFIIVPLDGRGLKNQVTNSTVTQNSATGNHLLLPTKRERRHYAFDINWQRLLGLKSANAQQITLTPLTCCPSFKFKFMFCFCYRSARSFSSLDCRLAVVLHEQRQVFSGTLQQCCCLPLSVLFNFKSNWTCTYLLAEVESAH